MVYGKYARSRRYIRRRNSALSTRKIFNKRSSKAQAKQIYALRKRVSAIARANRPETYIKYSTHQYVFNNSALTNTNWGIACSIPKASLNGNVGRMLNFIFKGNFEYADNYALNPAVDHQRTCSVRIIIMQSKIPNNGYSSTDYLELGTSGVDYELNAYKPFKSGTSSKFKILCDKTYTLSDQHPIQPFTVNLKRIGNMVYEMNTIQDEDSTVLNTQPKGSLHIQVITSGLHWDSTYSQQITMNSFIKYAYTDA